jgi:phage FluMu protein Com
MLHTKRTPMCPRCHQVMHWHSEQFHGTRPVQVYSCEHCDKLQAQAGERAPSITPEQSGSSSDNGALSFGA